MLNLWTFPEAPRAWNRSSVKGILYAESYGLVGPPIENSGGLNKFTAESYNLQNAPTSSSPSICIDFTRFLSLVRYDVTESGEPSLIRSLEPKCPMR